MSDLWFCPHCGQPMVERREVDSETGRVMWRICCLNPRHFRSKPYASVADAERRLDRLLRSF